MVAPVSTANADIVIAWTLFFAKRLGIEEAHMKELQEFNALWDAKARGREPRARGPAGRRQGSAREATGAT